MDKMIRFILIITLCISILETQSCVSDTTKELGCGYYYRDEGGNIKDILCENPKGCELPSMICGFTYNEKNIIAKQRPKIPQDLLYRNTYKYDNNQEGIYFWIISKREHVSYGPLSRKL
ncbi:hypothetical protein [Prevotella sp. KH2C16]|uniref:hypothetical protein n=1 Tax=Prevotella sp. KH2C16 TaxID=1855325 RepID=UPI00116079F3|nr:hypothetical protein [Prevotella sp. KH2C16]